MKDFKKVKKLPVLRKKPVARLDVEATVEAIGGSLTAKTPILEELSGPVRSATLQEWIPRLSRLYSLAPWDGSSLAGTGALLASHCRSFDSLGFYSWVSSDADDVFSEFLSDLRPQSLKSLEIYSRAQISAKTFNALNSHSESLAELKLGALESEALPSLPLLKSCTQLTTLSFHYEVFRGNVDLKSTHPEIFNDLTAWIGNCKNLRSLSVTRFISSGTLLVPVLQEKDIRLDHLEVSGYSMKHSASFHDSLGYQTSLKTLTLRGDADDEVGEWEETSQILARSLTQLKGLTYLDLRSSSDGFGDEDLISIAKTHPKLETWWTSGIFITDRVLKPIASMSQLKRLECSAVTRFSRDGLEEFFATLQLPGNEGFNFAVNAPDASDEYDMSPEDEDYIKIIAKARVNGNIEFPGQALRASSFL